MAAILPRRIRLLLLLFTAFALGGDAALAQPWRPEAGIATSRQLNIGGATLQVDFANGPPPTCL